VVLVASRGLGEFGHKLLSALRSEFSGHAGKEAKPAVEQPPTPG
jgi:6-phosphogluconate dehydrogenase (decarboxylating)